MIAKTFIKIKHLSLVNILLEKEVVKELVQRALNREGLKKELDNLFIKRDEILSDYDKISELLNKKGASKNAANFIIKSI